MTKGISNYENLTREEQLKAEDAVYKKQLRAKDIPRTLAELVEKQKEERTMKKGEAKCNY